MTSRHVVLVVGLLFLSFACSSSGGDDVGGVDVQQSEEDIAQQEDVFENDDVSVPQDVVADSRAIFFTVGSFVEVTRGDPTPIPLQVVDLVASAPAEGVLVTVTLEAEGGGDASLASSTVTTGADGTAELSFDAGTLVPAEYTLTATAGGVEADAVLTVSVVPREEGEGHIRATFQYVAGIPVNQVEVFAYAGANCDELDPLSPPTAVDSSTTSDVASSVLFFDLDSEPTWTLLAIAEDGTGRVFGSGCLDGIRISPDLEIPVRVDLLVLDVELDGDYDVTFELDLGAAAVEIAAPEYKAFGDMLSNDGACLAQGIAGHIRTLRPAVFEGLEPEDQAALILDLADAAAAYTGGMFPVGPGSVIQTFTASPSLAELGFSDVVLSGALQFATPEGAIDTNGTVTWSDVTFDVLGERATFTSAELALWPHPAELPDSSFSTNVFYFDRATVSRFTLGLDLALLVRHYNDVLLWASADDSLFASLLDTAATFYDCATLSASFQGDATLGAYGLTVTEFQEGCEAARYACYERDIERAVDATLVGSSLRVNGDAVLTVQHSDLEVSAVEGELGGLVEMDGLAGSQLSGAWTATRQ